MRSVGPYQLVAELGRGGYGAVYDARSPDGRRVALKLLHSLSPAAESRFARETRLLASLGESDGFVPLLDPGISPQGPFVVMPLVGGGTLRDRLRRAGRLTVPEALELGLALSGALGRAHAKGIVHRDVKPENVLYTEGGRPLVADLGLAKHYRSDAPGASQSVLLSKTGEMRGTPGYMAPEQLDAARDAGPAADIFAVGAVLYEALTGQQAFPGSTLIEVLARVDGGDLVRPREHEPGIPRWLEAVLLRALARQPEDRYPDGEALARALAWRGRRALPRSAAPLLAVAAALTLVLAAVLHGPRAGSTASGRAPTPTARTGREGAGAGRPLGDVARAKAPPRNMPNELAPLTTVAHGAASTSRLVTAGETILATGENGGALRTFGLDGGFLGFADPANLARRRCLTAWGPRAAWTTAAGFAVGSTGPVRSFGWPSPPPHLVFGGSSDELIALGLGGLDVTFDLVGGGESRGALLPSNTADPSALASSPDGRWVAALVADGEGAHVTVVDRARGPAQPYLTYRTNRKEGAVAWVDGSVAMADRDDGGVTLHDPPGAPDRSRRIGLAPWGEVRAIGTAPDGHTFAVARGKFVHVFSANGTDLREASPVFDAETDVLSLAWARGGSVLVVGRRGRPAELLRFLPAGPPVAFLQLRAPEETVSSAVFLDSSGESLATGAWDQVVRASGLETHARLLEHERNAPVRSLDVLTSPLDEGARFLASYDAGEAGGTLVLLPIAAGAARPAVSDATVATPTALMALGPGFDLVAFSPLGERAVLASRTLPGRKSIPFTLPPAGTTNFGLPIVDLPETPAPARSVAFFGGGDGLATALAGAEGGLVIETGLDRASVTVERLASPPLVAIAPAPDARWIAAIASSGEVLLLEPGREEPRRLPPLGAPARALAFSPDGLRLAVLLATGDLCLLAFPSGDEVGRASGIAVARGEDDPPPLAWSADGGRIVAGNGPLSVLLVTRPPLTAAERAVLARRLDEARAADGADQTIRAWGLARSVAAAPQPDAAVAEAAGLAKSLLPAARAVAWQAIADLGGTIGNGNATMAGRAAADFRLRAGR